MSLREQLEAELAAAQYQLEFAQRVAQSAQDSLRGRARNFEAALLANGIDQLTADQLATGHMRRPSVASAQLAVNRVKARLAGLDRHEAKGTP